MAGVCYCGLPSCRGKEREQGVRRALDTPFPSSAKRNREGGSACVGGNQSLAGVGDHGEENVEASCLRGGGASGVLVGWGGGGVRMQVEVKGGGGGGARGISQSNAKRKAFICHACMSCKAHSHLTQLQPAHRSPFTSISFSSQT